ncbi:hypothetical protein BGW39_006594 [Mortierella sp. 14UC]|nr:hypothetical protein BGW39_006594 [Mortierella sp. 14UC]
MDPLSQLPAECLQHILIFVISTYDSKSITTLASLLCLNRHIFTIAIPILYRYPFLPFNGPPTFGNKTARPSRALAFTLLSSIPSTDLHPALAFELRSDSTRADPIPTRYNYLAQVRRLDVVQFAFVEYDARGRVKNVEDYSADKLSYIHGKVLREMYLQEREDTRCTRHSTLEEQLPVYYSNLLYREAIWSLAAPILDQLESLTFPLSDIHRYLQIVDRLRRLKHAVVVLDIPFHWICCRGEVSEAAQLRKDKAVRDVVQFVKDHNRCFPACLRTFSTTANYFWPRGYTAALSKEIDHAVFRILPYHNPTYLAPDNWGRIATHRQTTDLGRVTSILRLDPAVLDRQLLQQCRALKEVNMHLLAYGCFDWAVQEKEMMKIGQGVSTGCLASASDAISSSSSPPPAYSALGLVPLERVTLQQCSMPSRNLDVIAFAFGQTLKYLQVETLLGPDHVETIRFGRGWVDLPVLRELELSAPRHRIALNPQLIAQCSSLIKVKITDNTFEYPCQDVIPWLPAQVPGLQHLSLRGWGALTFHPAALESTKELRVLKLSMARPEGYCYIPPIDELDASYGVRGNDKDVDVDVDVDTDGFSAVSDAIIRPHWTWDWDLPCLTSLTLTSEFAFRFEFKMLKGCPALERLRLHTRTVEGLHTRVISEADLFVPGADGSQDRIVAPRLKRLYMNGRWATEDPSVLSQFLGYMFPRLGRFDARGWCGVTIGSLVEAIRSRAGNLNMVRTDLDVPLTEEERFEVGVSPRVRGGKKDKDALGTRLFCSGTEYVVCKQDRFSKRE